ncbi:MAG: sulfatase-like hydrolase/transferase [Fimbriimonadaceae bacterium]|nr:sulfatase-like hydrolase/transferase [Chitinophagales bacterium]
MKLIYSTFLILAASSLIFAQTTEKPNVIVIIVDDLNDYVEGFDGHPQVKTPNINKIAEKCTSFMNSYCSAPGCAPSRTSFLSGKDVLYTDVFNNSDYLGAFRNNFTTDGNNAEVYTLPQTLKDNGGYYTYAINKIFHSQEENDMDKSSNPVCEKEQSWSRLTTMEESEELLNTLFSFNTYNSYSWAMVPDSLEQFLEDYRGTDTAIQFINNYANGTEDVCSDKPFFLSLGYHRPHSGRYIPEQYFPEYYNKDIYTAPYVYGYNNPANALPYNGIVMPPQPEDKFGDYNNLKSIAKAISDAGCTETDFSNYLNSLGVLPVIDADYNVQKVKEIISETQRANYVMAYIAAVQFIDAQIGRLLDAVEEHPEVFNNTIIVFMSDHGYSLGEKKHYTKWSLWETDIRTPLIISTPGMTERKICDKTVSMIDIFPTMCDLTGTEYPLFSDGSKYLDGSSFMPLLSTEDAQWFKPALTTYKKNASIGSCFPHYSVRTEKYHYIRYRTNNDGTINKSICDEAGSIVEEELYDIGTQREIDPYEWKNLANDPDYTELKNYLQEFIPGGSFYMQQPYKTEISSLEQPCFLTDEGTVKLRGMLYASDGSLVKGIPLHAYQFTWSNSLTEDISNERIYHFKPMWYSDKYDTIDNIKFYLKVTDLATGELVAFDMKTFYVNPANAPLATFNTSLNANTVIIDNYTLTGTHTYVTWDMGDGFIAKDSIPGPHTYAAPGTYTITHTVFYGNGCSDIFTSEVTIAEILRTAPIRDLILYPNPATKKIYLACSAENTIENIQILNLYGQTIKNIKPEQGTIKQVDIAELPSGNYFMEVIYGDETITKKFEVIH